MPTFTSGTSGQTLVASSGSKSNLASCSGFQDLDVQVPLRIVALVDVSDQVTRHVVEVLALDGLDFLGAQALLALQALPVELDVVHLALRVDELVGVHAVAVHLAVAGGRAIVGVHPRQHVRGLGLVREEVEEAVRVLHVAVGRRLERVDHVRELHRVADEEHRQVVADQVPVAFAGVELGGEAARIAQRLRRMAAVDHAGEAHEHRCLFAGREDLGAGQVGDVLGGDEHAVRAGAARVDDALGNALAIKALQLLDELHVLQQDRAVGAGRLRILVVADRRAVVAGQRDRARVEGGQCGQRQ